MIRSNLKGLIFSSLVIGFILISGNRGYSQDIPDSLKVIDAVLLTSDSLLPVKNAHIISKFNRWGTISNKEGRFRMYITNQDSLLVTSVGFRHRIIRIDSSHYIKDSIIQIKLIKDTISINEVIIRGFFDYETMKQIIVEMEPIDLTNFYPDWSGTELLYKEPHPMSFKGPVQALYDVFNRSARLQRKLVNNRKHYNRIMKQMGRVYDTIPAMPEHMQELPR